MPNEVDHSEHILTAAAQDFSSTTDIHNYVDVNIASADPLAVGSIWDVYITGNPGDSDEILVATGVLGVREICQRILTAVPAGSTVLVKGRSVNGPNTIKAECVLVGYDSLESYVADPLTVDLEKTDGSAILTGAGVLYGALAGPWQNVQVVIDPNGEPNAVDSVWYLGLIIGTVFTIYQTFILTEVDRPTRIFSQARMPGGGTPVLYGISTRGPTVGVIDTTLVGYGADVGYPARV